MDSVESDVTFDDIGVAFSTGAVAAASDELLTKYLVVLCKQRAESNGVQALAANRCITINTLLTQRFMARVDKSTTLYTKIVIALAALSVLASLANIYVSVR